MTVRWSLGLFCIQMSSPDKVTKELADALAYMLQCWQEQFGEDACDCRPEPENFGHICQCCLAKVALESWQKQLNLTEGGVA